METLGKCAFINLASCVEEFTLRLLDGFTSNLYLFRNHSRCHELEVFVETATNLEQKKVN